MLEPVPGEPAAITTGEERCLVIADYHAGLERALRDEGLVLPSRAEVRRGAICSLLDRTNADRIVFLGDLGTDIGEPNRDERDELQTLLRALTERVPITIVKGNHDGAIETVTRESQALHEIQVTGTEGCRIGQIGLIHGHTWPNREILSCDVIGIGHEHPMVKLTDEVGGGRTERVWLRGALDPEPFVTHHGELEIGGELIVFPAFNELTGGTWLNADLQFLSPFLPDGIRNAQAYLLDGTRLGPYEQL